MITIYGASDDLVEVDGCTGADEFDVWSDKDRVKWRGDFIDSADDERLRVYAIYDGCWHFSVGQTDADIPIAPWAVAIRQGLTPAESNYSAVLTIDAPDGTRLRNVLPQRTEG